MTRRSPRLAQLNAEPHNLQVLAYYFRVFETVYDSVERMDILVSAFEYALQIWPSLSADWKFRCNQMMAEVESHLPKMHEISLSRKLRLITVFQTIRAM
jgi:hypothetical protein